MVTYNTLGLVYIFLYVTREAISKDYVQPGSSWGLQGSIKVNKVISAPSYLVKHQLSAGHQAEYCMLGWYPSVGPVSIHKTTILDYNSRNIQEEEEAYRL